MMIEIQKLTKDNFHHYEELTTLDKDKPCYCTWWHTNTSYEEYDTNKKCNPEKLKNCIQTKIESGFHVGVLAYERNTPIAWISVGPINQFFWTWKRTLELGEKAEKVAAIMCFNTSPEFRSENKFKPIMEALIRYGAEKNWISIESYPFDESAIKKHGKAVLWPGLVDEFKQVGFKRIGDHWLSNDEAERSVYSLIL